MTTLNIPNTISDGADVEAAPHQQNYDAIETHVNTELINRDGSIAMTGTLALVEPTADSHAVRKVDLDTVAERRGKVAYAELEEDPASGISSTEVTLLSVTFTADPDTEYKITAEVPNCLTTVAAVDVFLGIKNSDNSVTYANTLMDVDANKSFSIARTRRLAAGVLSGSTTLNVRMVATGGGNVNVEATEEYDRPFILVEAIGP